MNIQNALRISEPTVVESVAVYVEYVSDIACLTFLVQNEVDAIERASFRLCVCGEWQS